MGEHAAVTARRWAVSREDQDLLAATSHQRLAAAYERGFLDDLVVRTGAWAATRTSARDRRSRNWPG